jgi:hypothetical protein
MRVAVRRLDRPAPVADEREIGPLQDGHLPGHVDEIAPRVEAAEEAVGAVGEPGAEGAVVAAAGAALARLADEAVGGAA